jgi:hypothetical protein
VFRTGAEGATYLDGIELVVRAVLQSAGFLYLTELGDGTVSADGEVALTPFELASSLSYMVTAGPPDQALLDAALSGRLATPEGRFEQLVRLRQDSASSDRLVRVVREWLELDKIETTAKDSTVYPLYDMIKESIVRESTSFVKAVLDPPSVTARASDDVGLLLGADWTVAEPGLAALYQGSMSGNGFMKLPTRRGILNQAAFLSVKAHAHESTPVLRGVLIARRIACLSIPSPSTLNIDVVPPVPDPTLTTRERFSVHTADPGCSNCHETIDGFGNAFEEFDGMGQLRSTENGRPVDSATVVSVGADFDGTFPDGASLAEALASSATVRECFARFMFRAVSGRSDASVRGAEQRFVNEWDSLPEGRRGNVMDTLGVYVKSPLFSHRRAP